jgi:hypothetical protein
MEVQMNGLTYSTLRAAERRDARKRFADRAYIFLTVAVYGAAAIVIFFIY